MTTSERDPGRAGDHGAERPWQAFVRTLVVAVAFAGVGFVAGGWAGPRAAAAPGPQAQEAEEESSCDAALPPGHPPIGTMLGLPPGHPPIWNHRGLPAGHPPIPSSAPAERLLSQLKTVSI